MFSVDRSFEVKADKELAWKFLERIEEWPKWAPHIRKIESSTPGTISSRTEGKINLSNGIQSSFKVTDFNLGKNWKWEGQVLWFDVLYNHEFEQLSLNRSKLRWTVELKGFGSTVFGRIFSRIYNKNLDLAIPRLQDQLSNDH